MDPFTIALATFGVQKLRGKSTRTALKDAALMGGLGQFAGMAGVGPFQAFGQTSLPGMTGNFIGAGLQGPTMSGAAVTPTLGQQFMQTAPARLGVKALGTKAQPEAMKAAISQGMDPTLAAEKFGGSGFMGLDTGMKLGLGAAGATLLAGEEEEPKPPFTEADYANAYEKQKKELEGITDGAKYASSTSVPNIYNYSTSNPMYTFNQGGIVNALPKFNSGGINYLPSKIDHDENDVNNYVRAQGYVEDGSGNGDKDEDTMLAQLADGEFVSRADAILGAGIMEGANPTNMKDMRKKGAAFFYDQQAKFKRIYDLLDAAREKTN
jgi:hypothetical protein